MDDVLSFDVGEAVWSCGWGDTPFSVLAATSRGTLAVYDTRHTTHAVKKMKIGGGKPLISLANLGGKGVLVGNGDGE